MKPPNEVVGSTRSPVTGLFQHILDTLPTGCAALTTEPTNLKSIRGFSVVLVPSNKHSAEFGAVVFEGELYSAFFGRGLVFTTFEAPWELNLLRSAGLDQQLDVLAKMCFAVIAGRCEHRFERRSTRGSIYVSEKEVYRVGDIGLMRLIWPRRNPQAAVQYAPYFPGAESHVQSFSRLSL